MLSSRLKQRLFGFIARNVPPGRVEEALIVAGTGRSGTTWLAELLRGLPDYKFLHEPLNPGRNPEAMQYGYRHATYDRVYLAPGDRWTEFRSFMRRILEGRVGPSGLWRFETDNRFRMMWEFFRRRKILVKFTRALRFLHWLHEEFSPRAIVVIIRHPCAVVHSMLRYGAWDPARLREQSPVKFQFETSMLEGLPADFVERFGPRLKEVREPYEMMAHLWAMDYHMAFFAQGDGDFPWILVPYERLVSQSRREIDRITRELGIEDNRSLVEERLKVPSRYASRDLSTSEVQQQLSKWKRGLTPEQIDRIVRITDEYGLSFYGSSLEPDYKQLMKFQRTKT